MTLIDIIREDQVKAWKAKSEVTSKLLTTLLGESLAVGKKNQREPNDAEVIALIKKFIKNAEETLSYVDDTKEDSLEKRIVLKLEIEALSRYLPQQMDSDSLRECAEEFIRKHGVSNMGEVMKFFKEHYDGRYDAKSLSQIVKQLLS